MERRKEEAKEDGDGEKEERTDGWEKSKKTEDLFFNTNLSSFIQNVKRKKEKSKEEKTASLIPNTPHHSTTGLLL